MPDLAKLAHVALITPNLDKSLWFFRDIVGLHEVERDAGTVYLRAGGDFDHHTLSLCAGPEAKVDHIGWRAMRREDVAAFEDTLRADGTEVERVAAGVERGQGEAIRFRTPAGHRFEIYYDMARPQAPEATRSRLKNHVHRFWSHGISPRRIDHVNIATTTPADVQQWMATRLGFKTREYIQLRNGVVGGAWMSVTPLPHDVGITPDIEGRPARFHHLSYYVDSYNDVLRAADVFCEHRIPIDLGPGKHGVTQAMFLYVRDPGSGHRLELYTGQYLIFDPDWEPIRWVEEDLAEVRIWWGPTYMPELDNTRYPIRETTPF